MSDHATITLRDVTLRDGLQDEDPVPTATKVALFDALVAAGITDLELTSFVRADRVPAMADAEALCAATIGTPVTRWGLVLNPKGAQRAVDAGLRHLQYVVSVSDTHGRHNAGLSAEEAFALLDEVIAVATAAQASVELTLATAFGCPFEHEVDPGRVVALAEQGAASGVTALSLADTIGVAHPDAVAALVGKVVGAITLPLGVHLHDTGGLGVPNALAAIDHGATRIDGSVGGLGGCPFAPGASGNLGLTDLVPVLDERGVTTGVDVEHLHAAAAIALAATGRR